MNILHLSDIHFGRDRSGYSEPFTRKREILDKLIDTLASLENDLKPDLVLVTGDIAWTGKAAEFDEAYEWFQRLKEVLALDIGRFVFCPGNHDLNRNTAVSFHEETLWKQESGKRKLNIELCDYLYQYENAHKLETRFHNYNVFCEKMGMQPYSYKLEDGSTEYSYLIGSSEFVFGNCRYVIACFNTAYLPYGKVLKDDQMFLGKPQIEALIADGVLTETNDDTYRIALFHHADRYLHPNEQCEYQGRSASLPLLMRHVDLALCGHTETGGIPLLRSFRNGGSLLSAGAAYYNDDHPNSFSILCTQKGIDPIVHSYYFDGMKWTAFSQELREAPAKQSGAFSWLDCIHNYPKFTFAIEVDGHEFELFSGHCSTKIEVVSEDKYNVFFNNSVNPARILDVFVDDKGMPHRLGIRNAPGMWHTMEAQIRLAEYHNFMKTYVTEGSTVAHVISNDQGKRFPTPLDAKSLAQSYQKYIPNVPWYKMVRKIEDFFDVLFLFPELRTPTNEEEQVVSWLNEMTEQGDLHLLCSDVIESWFFAHKKEELIALQQAIQKNIKVGFHFERKLKVHLFDIEIDLKTCDIYCNGAYPQNNTLLLQKIRTWELGDRRKAEITFPEGMDFWICPRHLQRADAVNPAEGLFTFHMPPQAEVPFPDMMKGFVIEY